ncbi:S-layer homology domain-containing protein [Tepidibacter aestuarii]|uniref:S-layer homology domain-containing protein n=1 Tax=Tepidibacter aestuarii TaxID=2925782 RepID=UPI0020BE39DD|nr:S-layer homology domain-containing protein [Tepidibacter aestuarii]CAH2215100.1 exported protein of unknown function [Tepidibacter aestuarii]
MGLLKRISKRAMAIILTTSMIVGSMGVSFAANFSDINNHWAANQIKSLVNKGIVSGYSDGTFKPDNYITRAEFISLINKAFNFKLVYNIDYKDVSSQDWFYEDLRKAKAKGYISGYEDNTMRPNNKITRQEVAVIMAKVLNKQNSNKAYVCNNFKDSYKIADWSKKSIGALVDSKNMSGYPDGTFGPEKYITRAEAVTVIYKKFKGSGYVPSISKHSSKSDEKSKDKDDDVVIDDKGDKLKNKTIDGDLTISSDVGDGEVYFEDVTVKGTTYVYGGGENSIYLEDCDLGKVVVDKKGDDVRLVAQGRTSIDTVTLKSGAILEEDTSGSDKLTKSGFDHVVIEDDHRVKFRGDFDDVQVNVDDADIYLDEGEIKKLELTKYAQDARIYIDRGCEIDKIDKNSKASYTTRKPSSSSSSSHSDNTAPTVSGLSSTNVNATSVDVKLKSNESGTAYYVVLLKGSAAPSKTQVRYGKDSNNNTMVTLKGSKSISSGTEATFNITGLTANTEYTVYVVASDNSGNISQVHPVNINGVYELDLNGAGIDVAAGNITGTTTEMEYSLDSTDGTNGTWTSASDTNTVVTFSEGKVYVRQSNKTTNFKLVATIVAQADAPSVTVDDAESAAAKLQSATTAMEYKLDADEWTAVTSELADGTATLDLSGAHTLLVRTAATADALASVPTADLDDTDEVDSISLDGAGIDVAAGNITGTTTEMEYSLDSTDGTNGTWTAASDTNTVVIFAEGKVYVRQSNKTTNFKLVATIVAQADAPSVTVDDAESAAAKLQSATTAMEYKLDADEWTAVTSELADGTATLDLSGAHTLLVRTAATADALASVPTADLDDTDEVDSISLDGAGIDVAAGNITGTTTEMEYSLDSTDGTNGTWTAASDTNTVVIFAEGKVYVRQSNKTTNFKLVATIVAQADAPSVTVDDAESAAAKLQSATTAMEYKLDANEWTAVTAELADGTATLDLSGAHTLLVRTAATADVLASVPTADLDDADA